MKELNPINFAHPRKLNSGFTMRKVNVYIYSAERILSFKSVRTGAMQPEPDAVCTCHVPNLDFIDKQGYLISLMKRVHRERLNSADGYTFDYKV